MVKSNREKIAAWLGTANSVRTFIEKPFRRNISLGAVEMKQLSESEFHATFGQPMRRLPSEATPPFEFWDYFESIPKSHFEGHDCSAGSVSYVWEHPDGRFQHVLVNSDNKNTFMVLVLDIAAGAVAGHRLLDLNREYGLPLD